MTPIDIIASGAITRDQQWNARGAICRHVRGSGNGPRYRRGSNSWRPNDFETLVNPMIAPSPCPHCGGDGDALGDGVGHVFCPACGEEWLLGDYDWYSLQDCLRYQTDLAEGLVETAEERICYPCRRTHGELAALWQAASYLEVRCDEPRCSLRPAALPPVKLPRLSKKMRDGLILACQAPARLKDGPTRRALVKRGWVRVPEWTAEQRRNAVWRDRPLPDMPDAGLITPEGRAIVEELERRAGGQP